MPDHYRFIFGDTIRIRDVASSLLLSTVAVEGLYGKARVHLDAFYRLDEDARTCVIDVSTDVGRAIARIFAGFLLSDAEPGAFRIDRSEVEAAMRTPTPEPAPEPTGAAA